ncbi:MAG: SPFH domain-containing protein [Candidatus Hydrogenedentes bacterium]|nr:SPFH domain-containing protein [Candidatus Hydrogenedentota bacterium]
MTQERTRKVWSGWAMLPLVLGVWFVVIPALFVSGIRSESVALIMPVVAIVLANVILSFGFFSLQPNESRVLVLFGEYRGTVRAEGFHWANPFSVKRGGVTTVPNEKQAGQVRVVSKANPYKVSLRARNFETQRLKVNDQRGNPIEIAAVVVWRVRDTAQAVFDVDDYENYVKVQSETGLRHLANCYPYDHSSDGPDRETTLRDSKDEVSAALQRELQARLAKAGVQVDEARLTHLAYAPEIASAMLRRQQAEAIIAARQKIVHGAVSMVQMALTELDRQNIVQLDDERKAAMVGNLLVVLCAEHDVEPVVNAGTLYH